MPAEHLLPIDLDTNHATARGVRRFRWFVAGLALVWIGALAAAVRFTPLPSIWPLLIFGALVVAAEHRFILFGDETSMSASIVVILCAVTYWHGSAYLVGPMVVASFAGLLLPHLRERSWALIGANASSCSISVAISCLTIHDLAIPGSFRFALMALCATFSYWIVNSTTIGILSSVRQGGSARAEIARQSSSEMSVLLLAASGALIGYAVHDTSNPFMVFALALPLLAFECRGYISLQVRPECSSRNWPLLIGISLVAPALHQPGQLEIASALIATALVESRWHPTWSNRLVTGVSVSAIAILPVLIERPIIFLLLAFVIALASHIVQQYFEISSRSDKIGVALDRITFFGACLPVRSATLSLAVAVVCGYLVESIGSGKIVLIGACIGAVFLTSLSVSKSQFGTAPDGSRPLKGHPVRSL